ncbi:MAG: AzlD domain-containing protein [Anderseniella sp.]
MTMDPYNLTLILLVTLATFAMRAVGAIVMARVELGPVSAAAFEAMPVAVLTAVIAPAVLTQGLPEAIAGGIAVLVGLRAPTAVVIVVAMATVAAMRHLLG